MAVKRLGKGLAALIPDQPPESESEEFSEHRLRDVDVSRVRPNPFQPRETFDEQALEELKQSIAQNGVIQPISVRVVDSGYELIAGERRLRAVQDLELDTIPAYILEIQTDEQMIELSLIENIQRENLNPVDEANGYQTLITRCNLTQDEVARKVGKERSTITNSLRLLKLPKQIQESLIAGEISAGHARTILGFESAGEQIKAWKKAVRDKLSVRQLERMAKSDGGKTSNKKKKKSAAAASDPFLSETENKLRTALSTQVKITQSKKGGRGTIEIEFYSDAELERLLELLENSAV